MTKAHHPVLLQEAITALQVKADGTYVDLTFGRGGHSAEILKRLGPQGRLMAMDRDPIAIRTAHSQSVFQDPRFSIERAPFSTLHRKIEERGWLTEVDGILVDLGVSSPQLNEAARGFSFMQTGPLDMRMDPESGIDAATWVNETDELIMSRVFRDYGEERFHRRIARAIVADRAHTPFTTTTQLSEMIARVVPQHDRKKHPATRVFQAIRIAVNDELGELERMLAQCLDVLAIGGRLCAISFHSLEDRMVKQFIRHHAEGDPHPPDMPIQGHLIHHRLKKVGKLVRPTAGEVDDNVRSRSARMRIAEKLA